MTDAATVDPFILVEAQHHLKWLAGIRSSAENSRTSRFPMRRLSGGQEPGSRCATGDTIFFVLFWLI